MPTTFGLIPNFSPKESVHDIYWVTQLVGRDRLSTHQYTVPTLVTLYCNQFMRIISRRMLREFWEKHPDAAIPLQTWFHDVEHATWNSQADKVPHRGIKVVFRTASFVVNNRVVVNIKGNIYRLIAIVVYQNGVVYIRFVGTHEEYDRIDSATV